MKARTDYTVKSGASRWNSTGLKKSGLQAAPCDWAGLKQSASYRWARLCKLPGVSGATVYRPRAVAVPDDDDLGLFLLIDEELTRHPFYGSRWMVVILKPQGWLIKRRNVQQLMRILGVAGIAPGSGTPVPHPRHRVHPYLLRGVAILRPNPVWSTDITYIRLARGSAYLVAIIDWYSRRVLTWRISNSVNASICVDCLEGGVD